MTERFELLEQLGRGGMGAVWKARDARTGELVALKLLHQMYVDDPDYVARFEREVEIARRISSPHVVKVLGYGERDGIPYVAMEYIAGPSLRDKLRKDGPISCWEDAKPIALQLSAALAAAHAAGVVHRDIKPSNILLDSDGNVKLADFGIARAADLTRMTGSVTVLGTPAYMSPDGEANQQSDFYGLGCVLYEVLTGTPPFEGDSQQQVLIKHIREAPNLVKLPASARTVVGWLLEKDPRSRPASAEALLAVLRGSSIPATALAPASTRQTPNRSRWIAAGLMGVAGIGLVGLSGLGAWALFNGSDDTVPTSVPTATPTATSTAANTVAPSSTDTLAAADPSESRTPTPPPTVLNTPSPSPSPAGTRTPTPTQSPTSAPTATPTPAPTLTPTPTPSGASTNSLSIVDWQQPNRYTVSITVSFSLVGPSDTTLGALLTGLGGGIFADSETIIHPGTSSVTITISRDNQLSNPCGYMDLDEISVYFWANGKRYAAQRIVPTIRLWGC